MFVSPQTTAFLTSLWRAMVTMSDPGAPEEVLRNVTVARTHVQQAWNLVGELRGYARGAEQAVEDAQDQSARARLAPGEEYSSAHLASAGQQLELVRVRCALTSSLASEIQDRLELAQRHVAVAQGGLDDYERAGDLPAGAAAELASLRAGLDNLSVLVELATPLAEAARTHMGAAAQAAAAPATSNRADTYWESMAVQSTRGCTRQAGPSPGATKPPGTLTAPSGMSTRGLGAPCAMPVPSWPRRMSGFVRPSTAHPWLGHQARQRRAQPGERVGGGPRVSLGPGRHLPDVRHEPPQRAWPRRAKYPARARAGHSEPA